ncbi:methylmalonyl-CoA epimerase/lactoylglutathione lyase [Cenarchaeum symbiosum A]|uniref:Methylmalonyl-CoA epimerase/lactoylglutathione lyase n=1 Tax=Cenarchaeum symbiosum (strain A) TaxID=414004 RepID=A0RUU2_CENSY|nr:methylmalonyl-CoA epimerase/lactoylglutathione lyase [Cenarchaeum symbiosum A]
MEIDHVAIAVRDVEAAAKDYGRALGIEKIEYETVEGEGVRLAILRLGDARIELMQPTGDASPIAKFLEKRGEGLHHIALRTKDIDGEVSRMEGCGINFLGGIRGGSEGTRVTFIHPRSLHGVLAELCTTPSS